MWNVKRFFFVILTSSSFYFCFISLEILIFDLLSLISIIFVAHYLDWKFAQIRYAELRGIDLQMVGLRLPNYLVKKTLISNETPADSAIVNRMFITDFFQAAQSSLQWRPRAAKSISYFDIMVY